MLRGVARLSLRRGIHTSRPVSSAVGLSRHRFAMAAGASVIAASYLGWRISLENSGDIALDSDSTRNFFFYPKILRIDGSVLLVRPKPKPRTTPTQIPPLAQSSEETIFAPPPPSGDASAESQAASDGVDEKANADTDAPPLKEEGEEGGGAGGEAEEEESSSAGGAFDPVTGKINWDCPCLGGMAHGPCGMQFREAFSCFVFSEQEPKGIDCVEKFKAMQDCFRENPDVYGEGTHTKPKISHSPPAVYY